MKSKLSYYNIDDLTDSTVLITGAGGTIGSGLARSISAKTIIAVDISEYAIYKLQRSIGTKDIHCIVGDVSDKKLVDMIFNKYKIDYVFNAAAYKHVDTLEDENNSYSVIKNNILSVINLCEYSHNVKAIVHISSDKAVCPTNNMGYTKLWCERIIQHYAQQKPDTDFKIVRFGNIYNSSGSFIETMQWQIENNLPITITDERMKRYFMTVDDAVTLITSVIQMDKNSTYILDMGEEISIVSLIPKDHPVTYIGIRPGEKLQEQLVYDYETLVETSSIMIKKTSWHTIDMTEHLHSLMVELNKDRLCLVTLNQIITTTTIL